MDDSIYISLLFVVTSAMLKVLYADHKDTGKDLSFQEVLLRMREILSKGRYTQIPQLTSSRPLDVHEKFDLTGKNFTGTKRAVMIGINYVGHSQGVLSGCHNDVGNMKVRLAKDSCFKRSMIAKRLTQNHPHIIGLH